MSEHHANVIWTNDGEPFRYDSYNRNHLIRFKDGAIELAGSAAPDFKGDGARVDPEEAFVAALASCHMLTFLAICARKRLHVEAYEDRAVGVLEKGDDAKLWISQVTLSPRLRFSDDMHVDKTQLEELHALAHQGCFLANSVKTAITVRVQT